MKARPTNLKRLALVAAISLTFLSWGVMSSAEFHHVADCTVCHNMHGGTSNLSLIAEYVPWVPECDPDPSNCGNLVEFVTLPDDYGDGDTTYDGICEVCHVYPTVKFYTQDGTVGPEGPHDTYTVDGYTGGEPGTDCSQCHSHCNEFTHCSTPGTGCHDSAAHVTHTGGMGKGPSALVCDDCHLMSDESKSFEMATMVADGKCNSCHSPGGAYDGINNSTVGVVANWGAVGEGIYESDGVTLKAGKEQWCATCHDDYPALSGVPGISIIVDNKDPEFATSGPDAWTCVSVSSAHDGTHCYNDGDVGGTSTATWTPYIAEAANYRVFAWWVKAPNRATNAKYTIHYGSGESVVCTVNQKTDGNRWVELTEISGPLPFPAGTGYVELSDDADGYVIADAIKFDTVGPLASAPKVIGDNTTYGFYVNGHGMDSLSVSYNCLSCHDASKGHIDGVNRTYKAGSTSYSDSFRLKDIDGLPAMTVPRPIRTSRDMYAYLNDFALCFDCHNPYEVLGTERRDESHTNFRQDDAVARNGHNYHIGIAVIHFDSDFDGTNDSSETCIACHNVHGAPNQAMIRRGELLDLDPYLNFCYLSALPEVCDTGISLDASVGSMIYPVHNKSAANGFCNMACHSATGKRVLARAALLWLKVIQAKANPNSVFNNGTESTLITASVADPDGDFSGDIEVDLTSIDAGLGVQTMYDDGPGGGHGDAQAGDGIYSYQVTIPDGTTPGDIDMVVTATDDAVNEGTGIAKLKVTPPAGSYILNDSDAEFECNWTLKTGIPGAHDGDLRYHAAGSGSCTATWTPDIHTGYSGTYNVYAWWVAASNRATNAPYTIHYEGDLEEVVTVNQKTKGSQWNYLGNFSFAEGTSGYVKLSDNADDYVIADAVKFEKGDPPPPPPPPTEIVVDNTDALYECAWTLKTGVSGAYNGDQHYHAAGTGSCTATWTADTMQLDGDYKVYAWWTASPNRATNAKYTVYYGTGQSMEYTVNQQTGGGDWYELGTLSFNPTTYDPNNYTVVLTDNADGYVIADAIKWEYQSP